MSAQLPPSSLQFFHLFLFSREILARKKGKQNDREMDLHLVCIAIIVASKCDIHYKVFIKKIHYLQ